MELVLDKKRDQHDPSDMDLYHLTEQQSHLKMNGKKSQTRT